MSNSTRHEARVDIIDALHRWCRSVDRLDYQGMRDTFHEDAVDEHGAYNGDVEGLVGWIKDRHQGIQFSSHAVSNIIVDFVSDEVALVESYVRTIQRYLAANRRSLESLCGKIDLPGGALDLMTSSRYVDRYQKRKGAWKIAHRKLLPEWKQVFPVADTLLGGVSTVAHRNINDYAFAEFNRLKAAHKALA